jgi:hypothetical protein
MHEKYAAKVWLQKLLDVDHYIDIIDCRQALAADVSERNCAYPAWIGLPLSDRNPEHGGACGNSSA